MSIDLDRLAPPGSAAHQRLQRVLATHEHDFAWRIIRGHSCADGTWLSDESLRVQYVYLTDSLIGSVLDDSIDVVLYLDKSGRPVAWLVNELWPILSPTLDPTGHAIAWPARPVTAFLNIDRLQWRDIIDPLGIEAFEFDRLDQAVLDDLRRVFLRRPADATRSGEDLRHAPTYLSGRRVLVVDEVRVGGSTVEIAVGLLQRAFPDATISGTQWMIPKLAMGKDGNRRNNQLPTWYQHHNAMGRGVGDRDPEQSAASPSWRVRAGRYFLSRPHPPGVDDADAGQLRSEIRQIAAAMLAGALTVNPSFDREDAEARCQLFNGFDLVTLREWREANRVYLHPPN